MATTPFPTLGSTQILSAYLNGTAAAVQRVEQVLNLQTEAVAGHALQPVSDQADASLRYRIYEGTKRGWLDTPAPVVYRNGTQVPTGEYDLAGAYGAIIFHQQQSSTDAITADFDRVLGASDTVSTLQSGLAGKVDDSEHASLEQRVAALEGGGSGLPSWVSGLAAAGSGFLPVPGTYLSHYRNYYMPANSSGGSTAGPDLSSDVLVYGGTLDAWPMMVTVETPVAKLGAMAGANSNDANVRVGVYEDDGSLAPGNLVMESASLTAAPDTWVYDTTVTGTLQPGVYWIARLNENNSQWNGLAESSAHVLQQVDGEALMAGGNPYPGIWGGYRATGVTYGPLPDPYPASGSRFRRGAYASAWLVTG